MAVTFGASFAAFAWLGLDPAAAALLGLAIAMSSSVVVVNITRSRRRTTDKQTEHLLIGWAVLQDVIGVAAAIILLAAIGAGQPIEVTLLGLVAFGAVALISARVLPNRSATYPNVRPPIPDISSVAVPSSPAVASVKPK